MASDARLSKHMHASGILSLAVDQSGTDAKTIFCCSTDETFGLWNCSADGTLEVDVRTTSSRCRGVLAVYGEDVYLAETSQDVITGIDQQVVVRYGLSAFLPSHPILTFSLEITALACDGVYLIAGSNDFMVKCARLDELNGEAPKVDRYECDAIVTNISISPNGKYFSLSTSDGYVQIRPTLKTSQSAKKPIAKFKVCDQFSYIREESPRVQCSWHPSGSHFYIPAKGGIIVVDCATWERKRMLIVPEASSQQFSVLTISSQADGLIFLAASTIEGSIAIWKGSGEKFRLMSVKRNIQKEVGTITSICFNPQDEDVLVIAYSEGYLCSLADIKKPDPTIADSNPFVDDTAVETSSRPASADEPIELELELEDSAPDDEIDLGLIKSKFGFNRADAANDNEHLLHSHRNVPLGLPAEPCTTLKGMCVPKMFAVNSTPSSEEGRYLAWNSYGIVKSYKNQEESTVQINFHDSTIHHENIIDNTASNYVLADINTELVALASKRNSNKESELAVHHVTSWDHDSRKWNQTMDPAEVIECLCVGRQFVAIYTSQRFLRVFTAAGTQRFVISLPGSLLTMCAWGSKLSTANATGGVVVAAEDEYEHQLMASIYEVNPLAGECSPILECTAPLPLSPYSDLKWLQFSASGNLVTMDSDCTFRLYLRERAVWIPVLVGADLLKEPEADSIWPIALSELPRTQLRYIYCRNCKYPPLNKSSPPPNTTALGLPVVDPTSEKGKLEAELMAIELQQIIARQPNSLRPEQVKEMMAQLTQNYIVSILKLFSVSCQMNRENRAAEMAHRASNPKLVQGLCNYAAKGQRPNLSEKVAAIGRERLKAIENESRQRKQQQRTLEFGNGYDQTHPTGPSSSQSNLQLSHPQKSDEPMIAPSKLLMAKRKVTQFESLILPANNSNSNNIIVGKNVPLGIEPTRQIDKAKAVTRNGEKENAIQEMEFDELGSVDGESELNTSIGSSLLDSSLFLDNSHANNPFKKAKKTPVLAGAEAQLRQGFTAIPRDESVPDFFDNLTSLAPNRKQKK